MKPNSPEMEIASNKSWPKLETTTPKVWMANQQTQFRVKEILSIIIQEEAHLVDVQLGGDGGGLMKPHSPEMEIASNKSWAKIRDNNSQS
jgi:hypothetical protein